MDNHKEYIALKYARDMCGHSSCGHSTFVPCKECTDKYYASADHTRLLVDVLEDLVWEFEGRELTDEEKEIYKNKVCTGFNICDPEYHERTNDIFRKIVCTIDEEK